MFRQWRNLCWEIISTHPKPKLKDFIEVKIISVEKSALPQGKIKVVCKFLVHMFYPQENYLGTSMMKWKHILCGCFSKKNSIFISHSFCSQLLPFIHFVFLYDKKCHLELKRLNMSLFTSCYKNEQVWW